MKTKLAVGAEVEFLTDHELREALKDHRRELGKLLRRTPIPKDVSNSVLLDATGFGIIDLGAPNAGRTWDVKQVSVVYQDVGAALAAGIAALMRGNDANNPLNFVRRMGNGTQIPADTAFSSQQLVLGAEEHLFVRISTGTASAMTFAQAQIMDGIEGTIYEYDVEAPKLSSVV